MLGWFRKFLFKRAETDPHDQCTIEFIEECKRQGMALASYDHQARRFELVDGPAVSLHNLFANWHSLDRQDRPEAVAAFVRSIGESRKHGEISPETLSGQLMPGIRPRALIGNSLLQHWIDGAPADPTTEIAWLPFVGELAACVIRDMPLTMAPLTRDNLTFADLPIDRAMSIAMTNVRRRMPSLDFEPVGDGVFGCNALQDYQSALLLLDPHKDYGLPPVEGTPIALLPGRNVFYVTGSANLQGLNRLLEMAETANQLPNFCSPMLLQWAGGRWSEFHFDPGSANADRQRLVAMRQSAVDYGGQKRLLDEYYDRQRQDIAVSEFMVFEKRDTPALSFTSGTFLASGAEVSLLPQAERVNFAKQIIDRQKGTIHTPPEDIASVSWSEAIDVVGHLFEPVANLYPVRFRVVGFPDADAWSKLKELSRPLSL